MNPETAAVPAAVRWHDIECGGYTEDLPLWRELAAATDGPILDVGAGTGRVALDLAARGHRVVALDRDGELLAALADRAGDLPVSTVAADARGFALGERFALVIAPMQTVQLLEGRQTDFVGAAAAQLAPGGLVAVAIAHPPEYGGELRPLPDMLERDGWLWSSQPVAIRRVAGGLAIERLRETVSPSGERAVEQDVVVLDDVSADELEQAGREHGLEPLPRRTIPETDDHVGSEVVLLRA